MKHKLIHPVSCHVNGVRGFNIGRLLVTEGIGANEGRILIVDTGEEDDDVFLSRETAAGLLKVLDLFIEQKSPWLLVGDGTGHVHVHSECAQQLSAIVDHFVEHGRLPLEL